MDCVLGPSTQPPGKVRQSQGPITPLRSSRKGPTLEPPEDCFNGKLDLKQRRDQSPALLRGGGFIPVPGHLSYAILLSAWRVIIPGSDFK